MPTENEKDSFWDIGKLVPEKKKQYVPRTSYDTSAVEIEVMPSSPAETDSSRLTSYPISNSGTHTFSSEQIPDVEYEPECPLINKVILTKWKNSYNYYEDFRNEALSLSDAVGAECLPVPYFSYVPQYVQLSASQRAWYLWWRTCVKSGVFPKTDYSYIILLVFEIINIGEDGNTSDGQRLLCELWKNYHGEYPRLDRYLGEWICDYSLVHRLTPPSGFCDSGIADYCVLKEFYVYYNGTPENNSVGYALSLLRFCSNYDYRKSKFAQGDNQKLYDTHITAALASVTGDMITGSFGPEYNTLTRDAYSGALCASVMKRHMEIRYYSFSRSHSLRFLVSDIVRYSENKIRAYLGIKSRLSVFGISPEITQKLDAYFRNALPIPSGTIQAPSDNTVEYHDYDKYYDVPQRGISPENAAKIEARSWETTKLLVDAFVEENNSDTADVPRVEPVSSPVSIEADDNKNNTDSPLAALRKALGEKYAFVLYALEGNREKQEQTSKSLGKTSELTADEINETAADIFGDIILEENDGMYRVIEDYREVFSDE